MTIDISTLDTFKTKRPNNDHQYQLLVKNMGEGLAYCQMIYEDGHPEDFIYLEVNERFGTLTGLTNVIGKRITEVMPNIKRANPELLEIYGRVAETGKPEKFEANSAVFGGDLAVSVYSPGKGYFVAVFENITERKRSQAKLHEMELRYKTLFEGSPYGIIILDLETHGFIDFNDQVCKQLGYTREEFAKLHISDIDVVENTNETTARTQKVIQEGREDFETKQRNKQGEIRDVMVVAQATKAEGRLVYHCIWRDITDQKKAEQELLNNNVEMKKMVDLMTGRELKMVELKEEINKLKEQIAVLTRSS
jgi:PAS domain S-box-containing protein